MDNFAPAFVKNAYYALPRPTRSSKKQPVIFPLETSVNIMSPSLEPHSRSPTIHPAACCLPPFSHHQPYPASCHSPGEPYANRTKTCGIRYKIATYTSARLWLAIIFVILSSLLHLCTGNTGVVRHDPPLPSSPPPLPPTFFHACLDCAPPSTKTDRTLTLRCTGHSGHPQSDLVAAVAVENVPLD